MHLFPTGLDNSLFPAIFIGVLCAFAATETLGWTFTGLVVPGYLSAVALVSPPAAVLMLAESVVSLALLRLLSDLASRFGIGSRFFGRERFFLVLILATAVRLGGDQLLALQGIPAHSIGLVLVPLLTHCLDKNGVLRGFWQIGVLTAITGAAVAALIATTNLTLADLSLTFDDVAFSISEHPKAYLVLLCGAFLAARANVAFGWDFHGIVVPGLLAVAWFDPVKVAVTLVEALAALLLARGILRIPGLRHLQVDGPRRLVLVFCADALLKVALVVGLGPHVPTLAPSDLYGFGYLLPALLADKMWQKMSATRVLLPAAQVSIGGFLLGNALAWVFSRAILWLAPAAQATAVPPVPTTVEQALAVSWATVARDDGMTRLSAAEIDQWRRSLRDFASGASPREAFAPLAAGTVEVVPLKDDGGVVVRERTAKLTDLRGLGTLWARPAGRKLVVAVPSPDLPELTLAAGDLARALDAHAVAVAGRAGNPALELLPASHRPLGLVETALDSDVWVELAVDENAPAQGTIDVGPATWPAALDARPLRALFPGAAVRWSAHGRAVVVTAPAATWRALAGRPCAAAADIPFPIAGALPAPPPFDGDLDAAERLLYAEAVVGPLVESARAGQPASSNATCRAAAALGLEVRTLIDPAGDKHLAVMPGARWAAPVVARVGGAAAVERIVGAPRARPEIWTDSAALLAYQRLGARALLVGAPAATKLTSSYDAAVEALATHLGYPGAEAVLLELRGGAQRGRSILSWGGVAGAPALAPDWVTPVAGALDGIGFPTRPYDGSAATACCGDLDSARRALFGHVGRVRIAAVYLSLPAREARLLDGGVGADTAVAASHGLTAHDEPLAVAVTAVLDGAGCQDVDRSLALARRWAELRHVADLRALAGRAGVRLTRDPLSGESFVVTGARCHGRVALGVVNLRDPDSSLPARMLPDGGKVTPELLEAVRWGGVPALLAPQLASAEVTR